MVEERWPHRHHLCSIVSAGAFVLLFCCACYAATPHGTKVDEVFQSANQFYAQGNFKQAAEEYHRIAELNFVNEIVYYNLANAYFKQNQIGRAILYYEKAHRLAPNDREITENLDLARARVVDKVEGQQEVFLERLLVGLTNLLPLNVETGLALTLFVMANLLFTMFLVVRSDRLRRTALIGSVTLLGLFLVVAASNAFRIYRVSTEVAAVVVAEKADVLSGPGQDNPTLFSVHEGLRVRVHNRLDQWAQISLENGWTGWIRADTLGII
jgi:hypothetical protein